MTLKKILFLLPLILYIFIPIQITEAQNLGGIDVSNIRADQLSEAQIRQIDERIRQEGLSLAEFERLAIQRGGIASEVRAVRQRIQEYRMGRTDQETIETGETRTVERETDPVFIPIEVDPIETDSLKIFGMDLFSRVSRTFEPSFNIPTPTDYALGPGDEVVIDIWGAAETTYRLTINAEGNIRIDNLGPIHLNGLTIEDAESRIINQLSNIYSGLRPNQPDEANTFAQVSLGNVRSIKVTVMGEVKQPATYTVTSLSTVFNALYSAGGPSRNGSFRSIQVIRGQDVIATLDVYDFLIYGDQSDNIRLRDQDIIRVEPYHNRIHVWGETRRIGFF
jgi:protein involved in polysaccharide export with SLBB domain